MVLAVASLCHIAAVAHPIQAAIDDMPACYKAWQDVSSGTLMKRAGMFLHSTSKYDSALVCYNIVANRYYRDHTTKQERRAAITAMNNIGYLYYAFYYDYEKGIPPCAKPLTWP